VDRVGNPATGRRSLRASLLACTLLALGSGCTIARLQQEAAGDEQRVREKEAALQAEQRRSNDLTRQKDELAADLSTRELTLAELNEKIEQLRLANARRSEENTQARQERERLVEDLRQLSAQLAQLRKSPEDPSPGQRQRIEFLRRQIRDQLDLLLH